MLIEEQIKKLQRIKAKIDLYKKVVANVQDELASVNQDAEHKTLEQQYPGLLGEFCSELTGFCAGVIEQLGNGDSVPAATPPRRVPEAVEAQPEPPKPKTPPATSVDDSEPADPLRFLMKYRHLDGKKVTWMTKDGQVQGVVRGMVTPNIIVETESGFTVPVPGRDLTEVKNA